MTAKPRNAGAMGRTLDRLREMIARGELSPGEQIRQEEMSELFQVSRVPLREAMNVLADQGLLFHRPHQGYFVTKRAPGERAQIRRMLHLLENELMQTIQWPDDAVIAALQGLNEQMRRQSELRDVGRMVELNRQFHFQIFTLSPNHLILEEVRRLWALTETMMWNKYEREEDRKKTLREHQLLIDALASRDLARCAAEMENHRYSMESGLPIELPGAAPDMPVPEAH